MDWYLSQFPIPLGRTAIFRSGTNLPNPNVHSSAAIGAKPDKTRTAHFGRD